MSRKTTTKDWPLVKDTPSLKVALTASILAGRMLKESFTTTFKTHTKKDQSEYTPFDVQAERIAVKEIKKFDPKAIFLNEELSPNENVEGKNFWTIDGIDGTTNFARGIPIWNFTMAYVENGRVKIGLVNAPMQNEVYYAVEGRGAYLNGKPIKVKERPYQSSLISFAPLLDLKENKVASENALVESVWQGMKKISQDSGRFHREFQSGGQELAWVASGKLDGFASSWTNPWDLSAGVLLVREAGGVATNILGQEWQPSYMGVIAGSKTVHFEMLKVLKKLFLEIK